MGEAAVYFTGHLLHGLQIIFVVPRISILFRANFALGCLFVCLIKIRRAITLHIVNLYRLAGIGIKIRFIRLIRYGIAILVGVLPIPIRQNINSTIFTPPLGWGRRVLRFGSQLG